jgi:hypothetical protein
MPFLLKVAVAGALLGFLGAVGIYFEPAEPYPGFITTAGTLAGATIALLTSTAVSSDTSLVKSLAFGAAMGLLASATVYLAKGAWSSGDAPFVVPTGTMTGLILGPVIRRLRGKSA